MARVLITGSSDGLGLMAAQLLAEAGHAVTLHAPIRAQPYSDSKLFDVVLAFAVARRWPAVLSNALEPGWVPIKMGGLGAPDDLSLAAVTEAWLAVSEDSAATVSAGYFYHQQRRDVHSATRSVEVQNGLLDQCANLTGVVLPDP
jgi:NAD(P)-dependent dehydrogenase (short-subunit alcohol dehydrogenase family)